MSKSTVRTGMETAKEEAAKAAWVRKQLRLRSNEYMETNTLNIFIGTWNVGAAEPRERDIHEWLVKPYANYSEMPDIYAIGLQELVELHAGNLVVDHQADINAWEVTIERALHQQYMLISGKNLVGICMFIYVKRSLGIYISDVQEEKCGVGIMGVGGNKGAVVTRFTVYDSSFCFVCAHLAAHQHNVAGRNSNYHSIINKVKFQKRTSGDATSANSSLFKDMKEKQKLTEAEKLDAMHAKLLSATGQTGEGYKGLQTTYSIMDHAFCFWMGDLNYRMNMKDIEIVFEKLDKGDFPYLLSQDQLITEKAAGNAFREWKEGTITFFPTYKYRAGSSEYERGKRAPAWCDRIQWIPCEGIKQLSYGRTELLPSDHRPVQAHFTAATKKLLPNKKAELELGLSQQLYEWESKDDPKLGISPPNGLLFMNVLYGTEMNLALTLTNVGHVGVEYELSLASEASAVTRKGKDWFTVAPRDRLGHISPGQSIKVNIRLFVHKMNAYLLNASKSSLTDTLLAHVQGLACPIRLSLSGSYKRSCFGSSVPLLVQTTDSVRTTAVSVTRTLNPLWVPKELWRMVAWLDKYAMAVSGIFVTNGLAKEIFEVRECLDCNIEFRPTISVHSMAEALVRFLEALAQPLFPHAVLATYRQGCNMHIWCCQALQQCPPPYYTCFIFIVAFVRKVLVHSKDNGLTVTQASTVFALALFHVEEDSLYLAQMQSNLILPVSLEAAAKEIVLSELQECTNRFTNSAPPTPAHEQKEAAQLVSFPSSAPGSSLSSSSSAPSSSLSSALSLMSASSPTATTPVSAPASASTSSTMDIALPKTEAIATRDFLLILRHFLTSKENFP